VISFQGYAETLCFLRDLSQGFPPQVYQALDLLARGHVVPTGLALALLAFWFKGTTEVSRQANQRAVLKGLVCSLLALGLAAASIRAGQLLPGGADAGRSPGGLPCWQGPPAINAAASVGFALGAVLWRRDWRWGLGICLLTSLWVDFQVICGLAYPLDAAIGAILGTAIGWLYGSAGWLDRWLQGFIRLARLLTLA
jgi:hypothetical protein